MDSTNEEFESSKYGRKSVNEPILIGESNLEAVEKRSQIKRLRTQGITKEDLVTDDEKKGYSKTAQRVTHQSIDYSSQQTDKFGAANLASYHTTNDNSKTVAKKSNIAKQLQLINQQIPSEVLNDLESAQPYLKICLLSTHANSNRDTQNESAMQYSSMMSTVQNVESMDLDQNLICIKCQHIVINPVECQSCQYLICNHCSNKIG